MRDSARPDIFEARRSTNEYRFRRAIHTEASASALIGSEPCAIARVERDTGDPSCIVRGEECDHIGDIGRLPGSPHCDRRYDVLLQPWRALHPCPHIGLRDTWGHRIYGYPPGNQR